MWSNMENNCEQPRRHVYQMCLGDNVNFSTVVLRFIVYLQSSTVSIFVNRMEICTFHEMMDVKLAHSV